MMQLAIDAPRIGIVGWKDSGKTTLAAALVKELTQRGLHVATVKSAHHAFTIDDPGTDSGKHAAAGAAETAILGGNRWAIMHNRSAPGQRDLTLDDMLLRMSPCHLVLAEGFKNSPHKKIEVRGANADTPPLSVSDPNIIAIATDTVLDTDKPVFARDDITAIADFLLRELGIAP
ncbi:MAG: molybdopterin-guanine dinucleotide biosynthesis protein B [Pseudomonadota bacterium]